GAGHRAGDGNRTRNHLFTRQVRYRCATPAEGPADDAAGPGESRSALAPVGGAAPVGGRRTAVGGLHGLPQRAGLAPALAGGAVDLDVRGAAAGLLPVGVADLVHPGCVGAGADIADRLLGRAGLRREGLDLLVGQTLHAGLVGEHQLLEGHGVVRVVGVD